MALHAGIDTGGTFTDLVVLDDETGRSSSASAPRRRPPRRRRSSTASRRPGSSRRHVASVTLGTTVGTNALLERRGARVLLLATAGFEDVPAIGRIDKEDPYDLHRAKPEPFVARADCIGVRERIGADGDGGDAADRRGARAGGGAASRRCSPAPRATSRSPSACSSRSPSRRTSDASRRSSRSGSRASRCRSRTARPRSGASSSARRRRSSTPTSRRSCDGSPERSRRASPSAASPGPVSIMKSNGGRMLAAAAGDQAVQTVLSGLSGGIVAGRYFGLAAGARDVVTFDMGGTSADIGLVRDGELQYVPDFELEFGLPIATPAVDLVTIGAGGGSIAWVDDGGLLRVGPRSAGAVPGPACYGLGGDGADRHRREPRARTDRPGLAPRRPPAARPGAGARRARGAGRARRARRRRGGRGGDRDRERGHGGHDPPRRGRARRRPARLRARRLRRRRPAPRRRDRGLARDGGRDRAAAPRASPRRSGRCSPTAASTAARRTTRARTPSTSRRSPAGSTRWSATRARRSPRRASPASRRSCGR